MTFYNPDTGITTFNSVSFRSDDPNPRAALIVDQAITADTLGDHIYQTAALIIRHMESLQTAVTLGEQVDRAVCAQEIGELNLAIGQRSAAIATLTALTEGMSDE